MKRAAILAALGLATVAVTAVAHPGPGARGAFVQRLQAADTNRDGALDRAEAAALPRIAEKFDAIDANHDGLVTREELRAFRQQAPARRFQAADTNGDGAISRDEFLARAAQRFERLDADHNGSLSAEELKARHRRAHGFFR